MKYLGLDLGTRTLGVSISDITKTIATAYGTIRFEEDNYEKAMSKLSTIMEKEPIEKIILGFPKNMDGSSGRSVERSKQYGERLKEKFDLPVYYMDERLTTVQADRILVEEAGVHDRVERKKVIDQMAAVLILQNYLEATRKDN